MAFIEASLEELPVRAKLGQSCLATKISALGPSLLGGSATAGIRARRQPTRDGSLCFLNNKLKLDFNTNVLKMSRISKDKSRTLSPRGSYGYNQVAYIVWLTSSTLLFSI